MVDKRAAPIEYVQCRFLHMLFRWDPRLLKSNGPVLDLRDRGAACTRRLHGGLPSEVSDEAVHLVGGEAPAHASDHEILSGAPLAKVVAGSSRRFFIVCLCASWKIRARRTMPRGKPGRGVHVASSLVSSGLA